MKTDYEKDKLHTKKLITVLVLFAKLLRNLSRLLHNSSSIDLILKNISVDH